MRSNINISWLLIVFLVIPYFFQSFHELYHLQARQESQFICDHKHDYQAHTTHGNNNTKTVLHEHCLVCDFEFVKFSLPEFVRIKLSFDFFSETVYLLPSTGHVNTDILLKELRAPPFKK